MQQRTIQFLSIALFICLLVWGTFTFLFYLGVPVHTAVLLTQAGADMVQAACGESDMLCRGLHALFPFLIRSVARMSPLFWFAFWSFIFYVGYIGWRGIRTGSFEVRGTLRPWHFLGFFILAVLLIFSALGFGRVPVQTSGGIEMVPLRRIVEPVPQVYRDADPETMQYLRENFQGLDDAGCLTPNGRFTEAASQFLISPRCMYASFVKLVMSQMLFIVILLFELLVAGRLVLHLARIKPRDLLVETMFSVALGACVWVVLLWGLASVSYLKSTPAWMLAVILPAIGYRHAQYWFQRFLHTPISPPRSWWSPQILITWLLIGYLAFNFLNVVRPFPIGWDDLGSYLNRPRLMVSYGSFIYSMAGWRWEYLTSLGYLLFGYASVFGSTAAMMINWMVGLLAAFVVYTFARVFLGPGRGTLSALLYYALPLVGHFSFADMKTDNAVFFWGAMAMLALFLYLFPNEEEPPIVDRPWRLLMLTGAFLSFAFATKATVVMVTMALGAVLVGASLHWLAFLGSMFFVFALFTYKGVMSIPGILQRVLGSATAFPPSAFIGVCIVLGVVCFGVACWKERERIAPTLLAVAIMIGSFVACMVPWVIQNNILHGHLFSSPNFGAPNNITPSFDIAHLHEGGESKGKIITLPSDLEVDVSQPACSATGNKEELDRYWGFRTGFSHYLTLPWRVVMNIDSGGYYVTTMAGLLMFPLLLLLPFFWFRAGRWVRWLFAATLFMILEWIFLANGIPWYGIGMFLGLVVSLEVLLARAPDSLNRSLLNLFLCLWILQMFNNRFWQYDMQRNLFEYPIGKVSYEALRERTIPHYDDIAQVLLSRQTTISDRPYLYRVGTFIPYFIPRNLEIIGISDHQLDFFNCLYVERDPVLTTKRLKALGFNSIIFDTNTPTIEADPKGSLHQKTEAFVGYLNNPANGLQPALNDLDAGVAFILIP